MGQIDRLNDMKSFIPASLTDGIDGLAKTAVGARVEREKHWNGTASASGDMKIRAERQS